MRRFAIVFCIFSLSVAALADQSPAGPPPISEASKHYMAGDKALAAGDWLTAVVEWEATLKLKPSSAQTSARLADVQKQWSPGRQTAYEAYGKLVSALTESKFTDVIDQVKIIQRYTEETPQCVADRIYEMEAARKKLRDDAEKAKQTKPAPVEIVMHGDAAPTPPSSPMIMTPSLPASMTGKYIAKWFGSGTKTTEKFTAKDPWLLHWVIAPDPGMDIHQTAFLAFVLGGEGSGWPGFTCFDSGSDLSGESYVHASGTFYLMITGGNCRYGVVAIQK